MKLHLIDRRRQLNGSFSISHNQYPHFLKFWHYHPELELVYIIKGTGTRFIGDSIEIFEEGEVVLLGKDLPHLWLNSEVYFREQSELLAEAIAVHFTEDFLGELFFQAPEMRHIHQLLGRAMRGIKFRSIPEALKEDLTGLKSLSGFARTIKLLEILNQLALQDSYEILASNGFVNSFGKTNNKRLSKIYEFIFNNFKKPIGAKEVASVACMNPSAFSRYFRNVHRKSFTRYLNEIRIGYACRQLIEQYDNIFLLSFESGFNNLSNFNRQFKAIKGMTPTEYIRFHSKKI